MRVGAIAMSILGIAVLLVLKIGCRKRTAENFLSDQRLFELMLVCAMVILFFDMLTYVFDGLTFSSAYTLNVISEVLFYGVNVWLSFIYLIYADVKLKESKKSIKIDFVICVVIASVYSILAVVSAFVPLLFKVNPVTNLYERGNAFIATIIVPYFMILIVFIKTIVVAVKNGWDSNKKVYVSLLLFPVPTIVGMVAQLFCQELPLIWLSTVISLLIVYVSIQNNEMALDALTGLFNRGQLIPYLRYATRKKGANNIYALILDLDGFKQINDTYGHIVGDEALIKASSIIKGVVRKPILSRGTEAMSLLSFRSGTKML